MNRNDVDAMLLAAKEVVAACEKYIMEDNDSNAAGRLLTHEDAVNIKQAKDESVITIKAKVDYMCVVAW